MKKSKPLAAILPPTDVGFIERILNYLGYFKQREDIRVFRSEIKPQEKKQPILKKEPPKFLGQHMLTIMRFADKHNWNFLDYQPENKLISFTRDNIRLNVYYSKMTVGTCLDHPTKGKTQLWRRNVSYELLEAIFNNPRVHTTRGYRKR